MRCLQSGLSGLKTVGYSMQMQPWFRDQGPTLAGSMCNEYRTQSWVCCRMWLALSLQLTMQKPGLLLSCSALKVMTSIPAVSCRGPGVSIP